MNERRAIADTTQLARFWAQVDKDSDCWHWTGFKRDGYGIFRGLGRNWTAHRVSWELLNGPIPERHIIDHICFNRDCVRPDHLRPVTVKQNQEHRRNVLPTATGYRGVSIKRGRYIARVSHLGKNIYLGTYDTAEQAAEAAHAGRQRYFTLDDAGDYVPEERNVS